MNKTLPAGRLTRLHVNQHEIRANNKDGGRRPVLTCKRSDSNDYGHEASIRGPDGMEVARLIYRPDKPLSCGARVWIETTCEVTIITEEACPA